MLLNFKPRFWLLVGMVMTAALMRLLPHPPNFTPVAAMALFGGATFGRSGMAFLVPLAAMFLSDLALEFLFGWGFHNTMLAVYLSFMVTVGLGFYLRERRTPLTIAGLTVAASTLFFLVTNFAVWLSGGLYPKSLLGLVSCYIAAIPFFGPTLLGDLFYTGALFAVVAFCERRFHCFATSH